jgi:ketosteroid isomerase-like protein
MQAVSFAGCIFSYELGVDSSPFLEFEKEIQVQTKPSVLKVPEWRRTRFTWRQLLLWCVTAGMFTAIFVNAAVAAKASADDDKKAVAALDAEYQAAVKKNDAATMDRILADDFVLVTGSGKTHTKADLLADARSGNPPYEHNDELEKTVRVWGDTAIVTVKLWEKGIDTGKPFDHTFWFSDTYVRTAAGWKYVFGQSSLSLPKTP